MALTLAEVSHPNAGQTTFSFGPFKATFKTVTFDNSYPTTGEIVTAAALGWNGLIGAICFSGGIANTAGTLAHVIVARPDAAQSQVALQAIETGTAVDSPLKEATNAADLSTYSAVFLFIGY